ncbi:MAG: hypothetical protein CMA47_01775, partial [Euryarchaeota archaeon]|nr:hypothetical protein [Euryarchaeota archaeon]
MVRWSGWRVRIILDLIPEKVRKIVGWILLIFGAVAILWGMYADSSEFTEILGLIAVFVGIYSAACGFRVLVHDLGFPGHSDEDSGDTEFEDELVDHSESKSGQGGALRLVIGISAGLIVLLSLAIAGLWIISQAANITIGGPPSALLTWEDEYRDMTGVDAVSGDGSGVVLCVV